MSDPLTQVRRLRIHPLAIPLRRNFKHATHDRTLADPIVVEVELASHVVGYGETLPRPYVTGETRDSVIDDIQTIFVPEILALRPQSFPDAFEALENLPIDDPDDRCVAAARAAVELALLDAYSRHFGRPIDDLVGWIGLPRFGAPGSTRRLTYSAVLGGDDPRSLKRSIRKMRWFRLRDFKLKVAAENDPDRMHAVIEVLDKPLRAGKATLRIDANGAWSLDQAVTRLSQWNDLPIAAVEQPLARDADANLPKLKATLRPPIMQDESLVTHDDAERLLLLGVADFFNLRLSKNGGFIPTLRLVEFARKHGIRYQLGCMVGETAILSAAGRRFLELVPDIAFAEGSYGRFLLTDDVTSRPLTFGLGGRIKPLPDLGWGIKVRPEALARLAGLPSIDVHL